jgi:hypothetical protein
MKRATTGTTRLIGAAFSVIAAAWTSASYAQEPPPAPAPPPPPVESAPQTPQPAAPMPPPPPPVVEQTPAPAPPHRAESDLDPQTRRVGIGYAGISQIPVGAGMADLIAPAVGVRIWASDAMGVDLALGFGWTGGSTEALGASTDKPSIYGFVFQGGLPFALANRQHVSFQVIPFATIAYGGTKMGTAPNEISFSGTRVDVGARAGFELFFGFIGIPQLSLNATVGAQFSMRKVSTDMSGLTISDTSLGFTTTVQNSPWDIFAGNVAARYYF